MAADDRASRRAAAPKGVSVSLQEFLRRYQHEGDLEQQRAAAVAVISAVFALTGFLGLLIMLLVAPSVMPRWLLVVDFLLSLTYVGLHSAARQGRVRMASLGLVMVLLLAPAIQSIGYPLVSPEIMALALTVSIVAAAFLLQPAWVFATGLQSIVLFTLALLAQEVIGANRVDLQDVSERFAGGVLLLGVVALIAWLLSTNMLRWAGRAERRARQLEAAAAIGETAASAGSLRELLNAVVDRIRDAYGLYYVQVFLLDVEGREVHLQAGTGRAGRALLRLDHRLVVGGQSVVGRCAAQGEPVVVNDVTASEIHLPNDLLPYTRAELALPLIVDDEVIGVLDVQSAEAGVFDPDDVRPLQMMAAQLAAAMARARLVDELQMRARENARLFEEAQRTLQRVDDLNRRLMRKGWQDFIRNRQGASRGCTLTGSSIQVAYDWSDVMRQAYQNGGKAVVRYNDDGHVAALPIRVHGETVGVVEVSRDGNRSWNDAELDLAVTLVERLALALENARLYEQAAQAVEREQIVNQIAQDVQQARSIDEVLQAALKELSGVLDADYSAVQIGPEPSARATAAQGGAPHG